MMKIYLLIFCFTLSVFSQEMPTDEIKAPLEDSIQTFQAELKILKEANQVV